jgi:predicted kinase
MIKLTELLREVMDSPKAIFLAGPAGSGKSYITKQLLPSNFTTINVDDTYEELLKASGLGLKQTDFTSDELSQAAKLMGQAQKATREKFAQSSSEKQNLIIDGTGGASKPLLKKKQELEDLGYECMMVMLYVSPLTSLQRNTERDRSLMPSIVLRTWRDVNQNINVYRQAFGDKFVLINNNPKDANRDFSLELIKPYFEASKAIGKPKSPEEQAKSEAEKQKLNADIEALVKELPEFDTLESAKSKINEFVS